MPAFSSFSARTLATGRRDSITTSPPTLKRKAAGPPGSQADPEKLKKTKTAADEDCAPPNAALPATPQTGPSTPKPKMDSEDECVSVTSSQDFANQDSDGMSTGKPRPFLPCSA